MAYSQLPLNDPMEATVGDDIRRPVMVRDELGNPVDLTGWTITGSVFDKRKNVIGSFDAITGGASGDFDLAMDDAATDAIGTGIGHTYAVDARNPAGFDRAWLAGPFVLRPHGYGGSTSGGAVTLTVDGSGTPLTLVLGASLTLAEAQAALGTGYVVKAGDTMTGPLIVPDATAATHALNRQTADTRYSPFGSPPYRWTVGRYYGTTVDHAPGGTVKLGNQAMHLTPIVIPDGVGIDEIGCRITTAGETGSLLRLGLYADSGGRPGSLIFDAGTLDAATIGSNRALSVTSSPGAGVYWMACVAQSASTSGPTLLPVGPVSPSLYSHTGTSSPSTMNFSTAGFIQPGVTGALPATATPGEPSIVALGKVWVRASL